MLERVTRNTCNHSKGESFHVELFPVVNRFDHYLRRQRPSVSPIVLNVLRSRFRSHTWRGRSGGHRRRLRNIFVRVPYQTREEDRRRIGNCLSKRRMWSTSLRRTEVDLSDCLCYNNVVMTMWHLNETQIIMSHLKSKTTLRMVREVFMVSTQGHLCLGTLDS